MKICNVTYDDALKHHPEQVFWIIQKLRSGKSKWKGSPGEKISWHYEVSIEVKAYSFGQLLSGAHHHDDVSFDSLSENEKLQDVISRMHVALAAKTDNRWSSSESIERQFYTPEIIEWAKKYSER